MKLQIEESRYVVHEAEIMLFNIANLPDHISLTLIDQITTTETDMDLVSSITFTTQSKVHLVLATMASRYLSCRW